MTKEEEKEKEKLRDMIKRKLMFGCFFNSYF